MGVVVVASSCESLDVWVHVVPPCRLTFLCSVLSPWPILVLNTHTLVSHFNFALLSVAQVKHFSLFRFVGSTFRKGNFCPSGALVEIQVNLPNRKRQASKMDRWLLTPRFLSAELSTWGVHTVLPAGEIRKPWGLTEEKRSRCCLSLPVLPDVRTDFPLGKQRLRYRLTYTGSSANKQLPGNDDTAPRGFP